METYKCKFCGKEFNTERGKTLHERYCLKNPNKQIKEGQAPWNKGKTILTDERVAKQHKTRAENIASGKTVIIGHKHIEESKQLISEKRKAWLHEHIDQHVWKRNTKFKSEPCEYLKKKLAELNVGFIEEYCPFIDSAISLDIAFPDIKIGIEVNGNQHYNRDGSLKEYYQQRHNKLEAAGWKIYELHYTLCYKLESLDEILNLDIYNKNYVGKYFSQKEIGAQQKQVAAKAKADRLAARKAIINEKRQKILNSSIDFNKFGWVQEAASILEIKTQKVHIWMSKYMSEFYKTCYHRKKISL